MARPKYPEEGELVLANVKNVEQYGVFVNLESYPGTEGMIHISEVSSKWVKNIREFANVGDKMVLKVLRVEPSRGHIDLSLKSVKDNQKKQVLDAYKAENRAIKLLELVCSEVKTAKKEDIIAKFEAKYDTVLEAMQAASADGEKALEGMGFAKDLQKKIVDIAKKNIEKPRVVIKGMLVLKSLAPDGVKPIRESLVEAQKIGNKGEVVTVIKYISAPKYSMEVSGLDYKSIEKVVLDITTAIEKKMKAAQGSFEFQRSK